MEKDIEISTEVFNGYKRLYKLIAPPLVITPPTRPLIRLQDFLCYEVEKRIKKLQQTWLEDPKQWREFLAAELVNHDDLVEQIVEQRIISTHP